MAFEVIFLESAKQDLINSIDYYSGVSTKLAIEFLDELDKAKSLLQENPYLFAIRHKSLRVAYIRRFKTLLIYEIDSTQNLTVIIGITRTERNPDSYLP